MSCAIILCVLRKCVFHYPLDAMQSSSCWRQHSYVGTIIIDKITLSVTTHLTLSFITHTHTSPYTRAFSQDNQNNSIIYQHIRGNTLPCSG